MPEEINITAKVMISYDYNHFEHQIHKTIPGDLSIKDQVKEQNLLRKLCQKLCDEAIRQYKAAKKQEEFKINNGHMLKNMENEVALIKANFKESEYTVEQKAKIKALEDFDFQISHHYIYDDDDEFYDEWE